MYLPSLLPNEVRSCIYTFECFSSTFFFRSIFHTTFDTRNLVGNEKKFINIKVLKVCVNTKNFLFLPKEQGQMYSCLPESCNKWQVHNGFSNLIYWDTHTFKVTSFRIATLFIRTTISLYPKKKKLKFKLENFQIIFRIQYAILVPRFPKIANMSITRVGMGYYEGSIGMFWDTIIKKAGPSSSGIRGITRFSFPVFKSIYKCCFFKVAKID